ncbi:eukaryotic translation initiation factor 3 subunit C-like [Vicia villosa]|uniref:eukaryotic translation initiation factor 3 subunit C-like n=1 Tax=Vicia villosa TaxID=3911 RepID=UPI00273C7C1D|nr:eukaryotic translation initiation factor 3 subunit C-like [Vicia villosa]
MTYEFDEEPVRLSFSDSGWEEVNSEYSEGVFLYESESKDDFEDSEDDSESEDDSKAEDKSGSEGDSEYEGESQDESESKEDYASEDKTESEGSKDESELESSEEGGTSEGRSFEGSPASDGGHDSEGGTSERKVFEGGTSEESEEDSEQVCIEEALKKKVWLNVMKEELEAIERNKTWELPEFPKEKKAISVRWVFKEKYAFLNGVARCSNQKQLSDVLTKDVKTKYFIHLRDGIGVVFV